MRGAAAVVVVVVAAEAAGLEVDEAAREGPGSGFSTVIRWVSSEPSGFKAAIVTRAVSSACFQKPGSRLSRG